MKHIKKPDHKDPSDDEVAARSSRAEDAGHDTNAKFDPDNGVLQVFGTGNDNDVIIGRDAAGAILVDGTALHLHDGSPTVGNTQLIEVFGRNGNDVITLDETNGALPAAFLFGGSGNDTLTGGSGADQLFGQTGDDILNGRGGDDALFGGDGNDLLVGGSGTDQLFGESGDDRIVWNPGDGSDVVDGGDGVDTLEVNGGNGAENFIVAANAGQVQVARTVPAPFTVDTTGVEEIVINAAGGDDTIAAGNGLSTLVHLTIDGGEGNDTIIGGDGADTLIGGNGNDVITGGRGIDAATLGAGDDSFVWNPGDASDVVEGDAGNDTLVFNGANIAEEFDVHANGTRATVTRNVGTVTMDLNSVENIDLAALGGADIIRVHDLTGTGVTQVNIDLGSNGAGDGVADTVVIDGTAGDDVITFSLRDGALVIDGLAAEIVISNFEAADHIQMFGLDGDDIIQALFVPAGGATLTFDGGNGDDVLIGSDGNDVLFGGEGDDVLTGGLGLDQLDGGPGSNILIQ